MSVMQKKDEKSFLVEAWAEPHILVIQNILTARMGLFNPLERAAEIIDALLERGWTPPGRENL